MTAVRAAAPRQVPKPRLGFVGVGWIGRNRMEAVADAGVAEIAAIVEPSPELSAAAGALAPDAEILPSLDEMLRFGVEGVVIATPSALHAEQATLALERGISVFCQKPLGRTAAEVRATVAAARNADRLLCVDMSYRFTEPMQRIRDAVRSGMIGHVYAAELVFHNAYGPDKAWFYDRRLSGGGCIMDLGVHLVDLALWTLDYPSVREVSSSLYSSGRLLGGKPVEIEDFAAATLALEGDVRVALSCSWNLHAGRDAAISADFHGTKGGLSMRNVNGSFYDFVAERYEGTARQSLAQPPDLWGGRAVVDWAERLAAGAKFDPSIEHLCDVAGVIDRIYGWKP